MGEETGTGERENCHQRMEVQVSPTLIIDPTAGSLTAELKICRKFEEVTSMRIQVQERAGNALKHLPNFTNLPNDLMTHIYFLTSGFDCGWVCLS